MLFFHHSITRLRAPVVADKYGNRTRDWANAARVVIGGLNVQPAGRAEDHSTGFRDSATSGWTIQTAPGVDVDLEPTDRVELESGVVCEVVGEVARWPDPWGRGLHHVQVAVQRVTG